MLETSTNSKESVRELQRKLFSNHSYGFRHKRSTHHAMDDIKDALLKGHIHVIDADLSKYFDTIAHEKLMKTVAEKIADKSILGILNHWLKAIVIKVNKSRQTVIGGGKENRHGTPQGGVISTLLANIYLNILDRIWGRQKLAEKHKARIIRYAEDIVILCVGIPARLTPYCKPYSQNLNSS